jgi:hypothetical protein
MHRATDPLGKYCSADMPRLLVVQESFGFEPIAARQLTQQHPIERRLRLAGISPARLISP